MTSDNDLRQAAHINARSIERADEITRLKAEVARLTNVSNQSDAASLTYATACAAAEVECERLKEEVERLRAEIGYLDKAYVNLLEAGRDKIIDLGGDCDPVEVMEKADPALRRARAALNAWPKTLWDHTREDGTRIILPLQETQNG
jgi:hypothetical protein